MSKVLVNETSLTGIAAAIREKNGETTKYKPNEMAAAITALTVGGGSGEEVEIPVLTGVAKYYDTENIWNWFIEAYGDKIQTKDITSAEYMFYNSSNLEEVPFEINIKAGEYAQGSQAFNNCRNLTHIAPINNAKFSTGKKMFGSCHHLRNLPEMSDFDTQHSGKDFSQMFYGCYSLRNFPDGFLEKIYNDTATSTYNCHLNEAFRACYVLDEIVGLNPKTGKMTSNMFSNTFLGCHRLKNIIFATNTDGTPYTTTWANQTIDLHDNIGWDGISRTSTEFPTAEGKFERMVRYNSGITGDKWVKDKPTYNALKNDPDWFSNVPELSRFNHQSCVNLINSLPDTSAYLATQSGATNSVILYPYGGQNTDEGGCDQLTEEEIAVAAAKGWTITYKTT